MSPTRGSALLALALLALVGCGARRAELSEAEMRARWTEIARQANQGYETGLELALRRMERASREAARPEDATFDVLGVHAGGPAGAFAAGVLAGWAQVEDPEYALPAFDVVTGSSSGSLIAPFAFVGDAPARRRLVELFCDLPSDLFGKGSLLSLWPTRSSLVSSDRVAELVRDELDASLVERIARGRERDRDLLIASTDLDFGVLRVWSLAQAALDARESGDPSRLHKILMASTSVPIVFPPVEIDGTLQTDGGIAASLFFGFGSDGIYELAERWAARHPGVPMPRLRFWGIVNRQLSAGRQTVQPRYLDVGLRSNDITMEYDRFKTLLYFANMLEVVDGRKGIRAVFRWVAIPRGVAMPDFVGFRNPEFARGLVGVGAELGADPASWNEGEPEAEWFPEELPPDVVPPPSALCPAPGS